MKIIRDILYNSVYYFGKVVFYGFYHIKTEGRENLPDKTFILASNHRTNADPPLIAVAAGRSRYSFVAKEELFKNPVAGWFIRRLGAFPVKRGSGDMAVIDTSIEKLDAGRRLVIFPEGARSKNGKVGKGKTGVALIAAKSGYPVVPAGIVFEGKLHFRSRVTIKFGKAIMPEELNLSKEPAPRELKEVKKKIMDSITELVEGENSV